MRQHKLRMVSVAAMLNTTTVILPQHAHHHRGLPQHHSQDRHRRLNSVAFPI